MEDPVRELRDVVRSITEPYAASVMAQNIEKYFTEDAYIEHPTFNQPKSAHGKEMLKGYYKFVRVFTINNKIDFHSVMFNEDKTRAAIDLTENANPRWLPWPTFRIHVRFYVFVKMRKDEDGKYRIYHQIDCFPSNIGGLSILPGFDLANNFIKIIIGIFIGTLGQFLLYKDLNNCLASTGSLLYMLVMTKSFEQEGSEDFATAMQEYPSEYHHQIDYSQLFTLHE
ncbi:uncharacterized protein MELLADRAFT_105080 [Melampsora larici-populina 98AG31]|uniref:SigF-like NTF2-like domain-containing protein n=1 Tax=Melampsora larici-populina (strain 98AG31 / pathotype 3-4-7) TaxID=747676 RepID=F4RH69_MELLP|nr:uncharacterized protein MELLADRAFT_105080 [Melampsora larici-populina 98AG31]EGG08142.1 hypothetical protein MELLADRAFT_105080 [Melampsora larici-populina 98AG31]